MTPSPISISSMSEVEDRDVEDSSADEDYQPHGQRSPQKPVSHVKDSSKKSHGLRPWKVGGNFNSAKFPKYDPGSGKLSVPWRYMERLNIAQSYGASRSSGDSWSSAAGIRELVQNMFDAIMQGKDLQPHEIQAEEFHNNKPVGTQATSSPHPPTKSLHIFLYNKLANAVASTSAETSLPLGYIAWRPAEEEPSCGDIELFNIGHMDRSAWLLGSSTKQDDPHLIGQYGDGLKIGINALLREDAGVQYHIGKEAWVFGYLDNELAFHIKKSTRDVDGVLIQVRNISWQSMDLDRFLFLRPPVQIFARNNTWSNGCVLLDTKHRSKIYVKGIFVRKEDDKTTGLIHGINIADDIVMSRDRSALNDREDAAEAIYKIWEPLVLASADARKRYIHLLLHQERSLDVEGLEGSISRECATVLFKELREQHGPTAFFFYARETTEQRRIIEDHLLKTPVLLTKVFHGALRRHKTIRTPEEAREIAFRALDPFIPDGGVVHPLRALLQLDPQLKRLSNGISFKSGHFEASIEISVKNNQIHLSENLLKPDYVHKKPGYNTCLVAQAGSEDRCDCCTLLIADYLTNELKITQNAKDQFRAQHRNLLEQMPRDVEVEYKDDHAGDGPPRDCRVVVWSTRQRVPTAIGFVVALAKHEHGATAPAVLIHKLAQGAVEAAEVQDGVGSDGQLSIRTKEPFLPLRDLQLSPGGRYTLQIRTSSKLAIWSIPQSFTAPPAAPSNIRVEKPALGVVHLRWEKAAGAESYNLHLIDEAGLTIEHHNGIKQCQWQGVLGDKVLWTIRLDSFTRDGVKCLGTTDVPVNRPEPTRNASPMIAPTTVDGVPEAVPHPQGPSQSRIPSPSPHRAPQTPVQDGATSLPPATNAKSAAPSRTSPKRQNSALLSKHKEEAHLTKSKPAANRAKNKPAEQLSEPQSADLPAKPHAPIEEEPHLDPLDNNWPDVPSDDDFDDNHGQAAANPPNGDVDVDEETAQDGMARLHDELSTLFGPYMQVNEDLMEAGYNDVNDSGECVLDGVRIVVGHAYRVTLDNMQQVLQIHQILTAHTGALTYIHAARYIWASARFAQARGPNDADELIRLVEPPSGRVAVQGVDCARVVCTAIHPDGPDAEVQIRPGALPTDDDVHSAPGDPAVYACRYALAGDVARATITLMNFAGHPEFDARAAAPEVLDAPKPALEAYGTFVDFYAGCGAVARGFEAAGFSVLAGVESDADAAVSWQLNFPEAPLHAEDVRALLDDLAAGKIASLGHVTVLSVSAPYVSSVDDAHGRKRKGIEHFKVVGQAIDVVQPAYILMDFAPALLSNKYQTDFQSMELAILSRQYSLTYKYLNPAEHGLPTDRGRCMLLAARRALRLPAWPAQTHGDLALEYAGPGLQPFVTARDAIQDLEWRNPRRPHSASYAGRSVFCTVPPPAPARDVPPPSAYAIELGAGDALHVAHHTTGWAVEPMPEGPVLDYDKPCRALLTGPTGRWPSRHPKYPDELLTPRELARIASFPDLHRFAGPRGEQYNQLARAAPPLLVRAVALCVREVLLEQYPHLALGVEEVDKAEEVKAEAVKAEEPEAGLGEGAPGEKRVYPEDESGDADGAEGRRAKRVRLGLV